MKKTLAIIICLICIAVVIFGNIHWHHKIHSTAVEARQAIDNTKGTINKITSEQTATGQSDNPDIKQLTADLPKKLKDQIQKAVETGKPLDFLIVTNDKEAGWPSELKEQLEKSYGPDVFHITTESYGDHTTADFFHGDSYKSLFDIPSGTDLILFESLILNDNQKVSTEDTMIGATKLYDAVKKDFPDATFILQPPNPVYHQPHYTDHVKELRKTAEKHDIPYIDHWKAWPDPESKDILNDLNKSGTSPNDEGNKLWAKALAEYFTSQKTESE